MALPFIQLYIGDVKKDTDLLSPAAFGAYMRLLMFALHESPTRGEVNYTLPQLRKVFGAETNDEALALLAEFTSPQLKIVDYQETQGAHLIRNRRMVRETNVSKVRSEAGRKGAEKTNSRFAAAKDRHDENFAENLPGGGRSNFSSGNGVFSGEDAENAENAPNIGFDAANNTANKTAKERQNCNSNNSINSNNSKEVNKGGMGEEEETISFDETAVVPRMLTIWKTQKPKYIIRYQDDLKALGTISKIIQKEAGVSILTTQGIEAVLETWQTLVDFILTDNLFTTYQLSQIEKYFTAIASKFVQWQETGSNGKKSVIQSNMETAAGAVELLKRQYQ